MALQAESAEKSRWGNHVPKDVFHVDEILDLFPDAKLIGCVRDPRDYLVSYKSRWKTAKEYPERIRRLYHPILTSLMWRASARRIIELQERLPGDRFQTVKYEELVSDPERVARRLCNFVGIAYEDDMINVHSNNSSRMEETKGIFVTSVDRWKEELEIDEVHALQWIGRRELEKLAYKPVSVSKIAYWRLVYWLFTLPWASIRAIMVTRGLREPLGSYLRRRLSS
jgi:hypothetical protein